MDWRKKLQSATMVNVVTGAYIDRFLTSGVEIRGGQLTIPVDAELMMVESYQKLGGGGIAFARALSKLTRDNAFSLNIRLLTKIGSKEAPWTGWIENELLELQQQRASIAVNPIFAPQEGTLPAITHHFVAKESPAGVVMLTEANALGSFGWNDISHLCEEQSSGGLALFSLMKTNLLEGLPQLVKDKHDVFLVLSPGRIDQTDKLSINNMKHLYNALSYADVLFISYEGLLALVEQNYGKGSSYYEIQHLWKILCEEKKCPSILVLDWWGQKLVFEKKNGFICGVSTKPESEPGNYCVGIDHVWEAAFLLALIRDDKRDIKKAARVAQAAELIVRRHTKHPGMYAPIEEVHLDGLLPYNEKKCKDVGLDENCPDVLDTIIIGESEAMKEVKRRIIELAPNPVRVLILGESGTGKELVAQAIHALSCRRHKKFITFNSAAMPETLIESELFGHVQGAFTNATFEKNGVFQEADKGTLFLDEIGDLSPAAQAKILRAIELGEVRKIGARTPDKVDVRIIAATNQNLQEMVQQGRFRSDLFARLNAHIIELPLLRERQGDIPVLIKHFLRQYQEKGFYKGETNWPEGSNPALVTIENYEWPDNVRGLRNFVESASLTAKDIQDVIKKMTESIKHSEKPVKSPLLPDATSFVEPFCKMLEELYRSSTDRIKEEILQEVEQRFFPTMPEQKELIEAVRATLLKPDLGDWKTGERTPERDRLVHVLAEICHKGELSNSDYENMRFIDNARNANKLPVLLNHLLRIKECPEQEDINAKFFVKDKELPILLRKHKGKGTRYALSEEFREKLKELLDVNRKKS